jgi:transposase
MLILGCDFHTRYQQTAMANDETGELLVERRLQHESGEADAFYRSLQKPVRVGLEATGPIHWFERLLTELGHELWIGDSAKIRVSEIRKQKTDERDARLILDFLLAKRFPKIWVPTTRERDLRQLLYCQLDAALERCETKVGTLPQQVIADGDYTNHASVQAAAERSVDFYGSWQNSWKASEQDVY